MGCVWYYSLIKLNGIKLQYQMQPMDKSGAVSRKGVDSFS